MALPRVSAHLPFYDPSKSSLAFGDRALPKLNRELQSPELAVRQQSLLLLADVLHKRENLAYGLREGIAGSLKKLLADEDWVVRERAAKVLANIAQHSLGRQAFFQLDITLALSKLFSDPEYAVRINAHLAVEMCSRTKKGAKATVNAGLVPLCVKKLIAENSPELKEVILETLHWCFIVDTEQGLQCDVIPICVDLLDHSSAKLRGQAARIIFDLTVPLDGKEIAVKVDGSIKKLVGLLQDDCSFVRAQTTAALMSIGVISDGKYTILHCNVLDTLVGLVEDEDLEVRLNAIKVLSLLAETPKGKQDLKPALQKLEGVAQVDSSEMVKKAAATAIKIITWLP